MGDYVWFHDVSWHATYAIYFFVIGICAGLAFLSYGSWVTPELRPLRFARLPSTSPAHAARDFAAKLAAWQAVREALADAEAASTPRPHALAYAA